MMAKNGYASKDEDSNDDNQNPNENVFTIPPFTAEQELREKASLTADERRSIMVDVFGLGHALSGFALVGDGSNATRSRNDEVDVRQHMQNANTLEPAHDCTGMAANGGGSHQASEASLQAHTERITSAINQIPENEKEAYLMALLQCPDQIFSGWRKDTFLEKISENSTIDATPRLVPSRRQIMHHCLHQR